MLERGSSLAEHGIMPIDDFETVLFEHSRVDEGSKRLRDETLTAAACLIPVAAILPKSFVNAIMSHRMQTSPERYLDCVSCTQARMSQPILSDFSDDMFDAQVRFVP